MLGLTGFEDRGDHQVPRHLHAPPYPLRLGAGHASPAHVRAVPAGPPQPSLRIQLTGDDRTHDTRLTQYAHGGGCACKIPPGELE